MPEVSERMCFTLEHGLCGEDGGAADDVQLLPYGEVRPKGKTEFVVDDEAKEMILAAFLAGSTDLVIDYEHQSLSGSEAPAAGWVKELVDRGEDGIWAKVTWTERARGYLESREYRYISPVVLIRKSDGRAVELLGAALTNLPAIDGMVPVANSSAHPDGADTIDGADYRTMYGSVMGLLGLGEDDGPDAAGMAVAALSRPDGFVSVAEYDAAVEGLKDTLRSREADAMIREALTDGRLTPPMLGWAREYAAADIEGFTAFLKTACPVVPLSSLQGVATHVVDAGQRRVNGLLGISDDLFVRQTDAG